MEEKKEHILFRFKSIQTTILLSFFVLVLTALTVFFIISLKYTEESIIDNSTNYTEQLIKQVNSDMDSYISYMDNISELLSRNSDVRNYLFQNGFSEEVRQSQYGRILGQFQTIMNTRKDICNIAVIGENGSNIINRGNSRLNPYVTLSRESWYREAKERETEFVLSTSHIQNAIADKYEWVITLSRAIINPETDRIEGVFFVDMNYNAISDLCANVSLGEKGYIYVLDEAGNVIFHPQQQLLYSGLKEEVIHKVLDKNDEDNSFIQGSEEERKVYTVSKSRKTGWTIVGVSFMSELMKNRERTQMMYLLVTCLLLIGAVLMAVYLSKAITKPIKKLDRSMKSVEKGDFINVEIDDLAENEIGRLGKSFNMMTQEIQMLMEQNVQEQKQKRKAEMRALQAQIHPHFLYNTLDSIIWMAESGKYNNEVVVMTSSLAKLLRRSIGNEKELVTIEEELEYTETYLTIQAIRYRDQMVFDIQADPEILKERIVKFTLQPLVENAIYHGIKYIEEKGMIQIRGKMGQDEIILQVIDNGKGMEKEETAHIFEKHAESPKSNGIGVYNIQNRLQLYYGKEYGLFYESEPFKGTTVTVRIPIIKEGQYEAE